MTNADLTRLKRVIAYCITAKIASREMNWTYMTTIIWKLMR